MTYVGTAVARLRAWSLFVTPLLWFSDAMRGKEMPHEPQTWPHVVQPLRVAPAVLIPDVDHVVGICVWIVETAVRVRKVIAAGVVRSPDSSRRRRTACSGVRGLLGGGCGLSG